MAEFNPHIQVKEISIENVATTVKQHFKQKISEDEPSEMQEYINFATRRWNKTGLKRHQEKNCFLLNQP